MGLTGPNSPGYRTAAAAWYLLLAYPARQMRARHRRLRTHAPHLLPRLLASAPLMWLASVVTGAGALAERRGAGHP